MISDSVKRAAKILLSIVAAPVVIGAFLFGVTFLINVRDEPLLPQVRSALSAPHADVPANENLFFSLLAFDVQNSADLSTEGQWIFNSITTYDPVMDESIAEHELEFAPPA